MQNCMACVMLDRLEFDFSLDFVRTAERRFRLRAGESWHLLGCINEA